jgi:hypothetical protein
MMTSRELACTSMNEPTCSKAWCCNLQHHTVECVRMIRPTYNKLQQCVPLQLQLQVSLHRTAGSRMMCHCAATVILNSLARRQVKLHLFSHVTDQGVASQTCFICARECLLRMHILDVTATSYPRTAKE